MKARYPLRLDVSSDRVLRMRQGARGLVRNAEQRLPVYLLHLSSSCSQKHLLCYPALTKTWEKLAVLQLLGRTYVSSLRLALSTKHKYLLADMALVYLTSESGSTCSKSHSLSGIQKERERETPPGSETKMTNDSVK